MFLRQLVEVIAVTRGLAHHHPIFAGAGQPSWQARFVLQAFQHWHAIPIVLKDRNTFKGDHRLPRKWTMVSV